jgi:hypothetical protein
VHFGDSIIIYESKVSGQNIFLWLKALLNQDHGDSGYADNTAVWVVAEGVQEAQQELQRLVDAMVKYSRDNGLALNGAKTQVMIRGKANARDKA